MNTFDRKAHATRIGVSTADESLRSVIGLFDGLTNGKVEGDRLVAMFLFATEGPDIRLALLMDCYICGLHAYIVHDGPIFTAANIAQIRELLRVADERQARLLADGSPLAIGDNLKVLYCRGLAPRTDDKLLPHDVADELLTHFWALPVPRPDSEEFLQMFEPA